MPLPTPKPLTKHYMGSPVDVRSFAGRPPALVAYLDPRPLPSSCATRETLVHDVRRSALVREPGGGLNRALGKALIVPLPSLRGHVLI